MPQVSSRTFRLASDNSNQVALFTLGGVALIFVAVIGFVINLFTSQGQITLHMMSTVPTIIAFSLLTHAWNLAKAPQEISVGEEGISTIKGNNVVTTPWEQVGMVSQGEAGIQQQKYLDVMNVEGKRIARIPSVVEGYEDLVTILRQQVASQNPERSSTLHRRKARWQALGAFAFAAFMIAGSVFMTTTAIDQQRVDALLAEQGIESTAPIVRRFLAPNGVTTRIEFEVTSDDGQSVIHNKEVTPAYYEYLADATEVPIKTVPNHPDATILLEGLVEGSTTNPVANYLVSAGLGLFGLLALGVGVMFWLGYDFVIEPETKTYGFRPLGEVRTAPAETETS